MEKEVFPQFAPNPVTMEQIMEWRKGLGNGTKSANKASVESSQDLQDMPPLEETPLEEHSPEQFVSQSSSGNEADDESSRGLQDITPLKEPPLNHSVGQSEADVAQSSDVIPPINSLPLEQSGNQSRPLSRDMTSKQFEENKETKSEEADGQTEVKPDQKNGKVIEWNKSFKLKKILFDQQQQQLERSESSSSSSSSYIGSSLPDDDTKYKLLDSDSDVDMSHNSRQIHLLKTRKEFPCKKQVFRATITNVPAMSVANNNQKTKNCHNSSTSLPRSSDESESDPNSDNAENNNLVEVTTAPSEENSNSTPETNQNKDEGIEFTNNEKLSACFKDEDEELINVDKSSNQGPNHLLLQ